MKIYTVLIIGLLFSAYSNGQTKIAINELHSSGHLITEKQIDLIFEKSKDFPNNTAVSIAIIENGNTCFYGVKRKNDTLIYSENFNNIFEIGSISKVFTSTILANFILGNKVNLNDSIQEYIEIPIKLKDKISLKELANHTSGLPRLPSNLDLFTADPKNPYKDYGENELTEYLSEEIELNQIPGSKYEYSNLGAGLLGYILTQQSNSTYNDLLSKYVFSKYNMNNSTIFRDSIKTKLVDGLDNFGNKTSNWDLNVLVGAGGILSSVHDLSKFAKVQFNMNNKELELTRQTTFSVNEKMDVGLGWHIIKTKSDGHFYWHNGGTGGYSSSMAIDVYEKNGVIILSNVSAFNKNRGNIDNLSFELMKTLKQ